MCPYGISRDFDEIIEGSRKLHNDELRNLYSLPHVFVVRGSVVVKALYYKPEGHGFDSRWGEFLN
jgi:hypothetical protein